MECSFCSAAHLQCPRPTIAPVRLLWESTVLQAPHHMRGHRAAHPPLLLFASPPLVEACEKGSQDQASGPRPFPTPFCFSREAFPHHSLHDGDTKQLFMSKQSPSSSPTFPSPLSRPHRSSLPTNFRQASKTFSHSSPNRKFLPTNFRQASKTFTHGSLLHSSASHSHTPASATSMAPSTPLESRATVSAFDAASRTSTEEPPGHLGFPGLSSDLRGCVGVGEGPQPSTGGAFFSPWSVEASFPGFLQSPFEQQWPAEGRTGSQNLSEDAACSLDAAPASPEDWRSVHMAMAVAAEQGEHVPLPSEDFDAEKMETCPTSPMSSVAKEVAHSAAKPCAYSSRCSIPCSSPDQGSFRPSHADRACTTPGSWNSPRSSDSARRSQVSNTFARLSNAFSRLFMDDQKQSHSPRMSGKPGHPQPQVKVTLPSSLGHVSISDPQEPLPTVLSSSLYLPCNKCSSSHSECSPLNIRAAAPTLHDTAAHTCALNAAQQQQGVARGCVHMHAHPVSLFGSASVW
ncbi:hypothetical protein DUNSADRAFT_17873 [Dunaliella salina]|uniref:Uncharacterized protein n=1 Tax=Dunaliella salina TaxID=3046 RepID=A0ABQ7G0X5_DUNSA|nr:hypothetical protein DUNSADRAFT_17873 [Dunaliella salina]|eukprot:KAF5828264.1 hypothetical protein DUNSADRAFT_17873 [Dunaliella salina]